MQPYSMTKFLSSSQFLFRNQPFCRSNDRQRSLKIQMEHYTECTFLQKMSVPGKTPSTAMASFHVIGTKITFRQTYEVTASCQRVHHAHKLLCHTPMPYHLIHLWASTHVSETASFSCLLKSFCTLDGYQMTVYLTSNVDAAAFHKSQIFHNKFSIFSPPSFLLLPKKHCLSPRHT